MKAEDRKQAKEMERVSMKMDEVRQYKSQREEHAIMTMRETRIPQGG